MSFSARKIFKVQEIFSSQYHCLNQGLLEVFIFDVLYFFVLSLEVNSVDVRFWIFYFFFFLSFFRPFGLLRAETRRCETAAKIPDAENKLTL